MVSIAKILLFLQIVIIAAAVGAVVAFSGLLLVAGLSGGDDINGGLAMGAAGFAPVGALVGAALGVWLAWRTIARTSDTVILAGGYGLAVLAAGAVGGWFFYQEMTDGDPYTSGAEPTVLIEWRLPEVVRHDWVDRIFRYTMRSSYMDWTLSTGWDEPRARDEDARTILRMRAKIRWRVTGRVFQLWRAPDHNDRITVGLGLSRDPEPTQQYGAWHEVEGAPGHAFRTRVVVK